MNETVKRINPGAELCTPEKCYIIELSNTADDPGIPFPGAGVARVVTPRWHRVVETIERYVILAGRGRVEVGNLAPEEVGAGDVVLIPGSCRQRIANIGGED